MRAYLLAQGSIVTLLALALLFAPGLMMAVWPWPLTRLLTQLYSAPFLSYGLGSILLARRRTWSEIRVAIVAMLVFAGGVLIASLIHRALFSVAGLSGWLWFGGFAVITFALGLSAGRGLKTGADYYRVPMTSLRGEYLVYHQNR